MKNIAVLGAGTMGNGIAHTFAQFGFSVSLVDISEKALKEALLRISMNLDRQVKKEKITETEKSQTLRNIKTFTLLKNGVSSADLVVEAISENLDLKLSIFKELDEICPPETILASNTSSISITKIASVTNRPAKVVGMHFMNPVPVMKLVEVIRGYLTSDETASRVFEATSKLMKVGVEVNDYPGFIANRILMPMINESIISLQQGVAGVAEIDNIMKLGMAHPMGPLQLADFIGLDVCLSILDILFEGFGDSKYKACSLLKNMVMANKLGVKSGEGFYTYIRGTKDAEVSSNFKQ